MRNAKHLIRALLLLLVVGGVVDLGRRLLVPPSFGVYGHFRAANLKEQRDLPIQFAKSNTGDCVTCHDSKVATLLSSHHKVLACMNCHGPLNEHITVSKDGSDMEKTGEMRIERSYKHCARCHQKQSARAGKLAQVEILDHVRAMGASLQETVCLNCHNPHKPGMQK